MRIQNNICVAVVALFALSTFSASALEIRQRPTAPKTLTAGKDVTFESLCKSGQMQFDTSTGNYNILFVKFGNIPSKEGTVDVSDYTVVPYVTEYVTTVSGAVSRSESSRFESVVLEIFKCSLLLGEETDDNGSSVSRTRQIWVRVLLSTAFLPSKSANDVVYNALMSMTDPVTINGNMWYANGKWRNNIDLDKRSLGNLDEVTVVISPYTINGIKIEAR